MTIIAREDIPLAAPRFQAEMFADFNGWFWHWLGTAYPEAMSEEQMLMSAQRFHMGTRKWSDIAYSFAVGRSGRKYELRGWDVKGGHTLGFNNSSHAIVFLIGAGQKPTPAQFRAAWEIVNERPGVVRSHRDVGNTQCPGDDIAREIKDPSFKGNLMTTPTPDQATGLVRRAYIDILGRVGEATGVTFWSDSLINRTWTLEDMRWEFLKTRLAAMSAQQTELANQLRLGTNPGDAQRAADAAYQLFLDDLIALRS